MGIRSCHSFQPEPDHISIDPATELLPPRDITTCPTTLVFPTSHSQPTPLIKDALTLSQLLRIQNPKKPKAGEGGMTGGQGVSAIQSAANGVDGLKLMKGEVNDAAFLRQKRSNIPVDQASLRFYPSRPCLIASR